MPRGFVILLCCAMAAHGQSAALAALGKGNTLMQAERYQEASAAFQEALNANAQLTEARKNLAICEFELRDYESARRDFQAVKDSYYLGRLELLDGHFASAIALLQAAQQKKAPVDSAYYIGIAEYKAGHLTEATTTLQSYLHRNPRDFRAHQWLARAFAKAGNSIAANQEFARTRDLHDYYTQGSVTLATCSSLLNQGKQVEAWQACGSLTSTDDADKAAAFGMLFGNAGDHPHALAFWSRAVTLDPGSPEANYNLALAYFQTQAISQSAIYAKAARDIWPQFPEANILYGTVLYMLRRDQEAIQVLNDAHALRPEDQNVIRLLAELQSHPK